ncbi:MAG: DEAD/DEAH box helicase [Proteobacteria bacterium]|nr:DEAD/DEAH box helicase [Pseudomonadota bacterium]
MAHVGGVDELNKLIKQIKRYCEITYHKIYPEEQEKFIDVEDEIINSFLQKRGIRLYSHQFYAISKILEGKNVCVATPTASGKTFCYHIPIIRSLVSDKNSKAILIYPLKALAQDQKKKLTENLEIISPFYTCDIYDGDTKQVKRDKIKRNIPHCILTNPDMLHYGLLPHHYIWEELFSNLRYIVVDEVHTYRGVFGANVGWIFRRLKRIAKFYGSAPQIITTSATIGNPKEFLSGLFEEDFEIITERGDYSSERHFIIINPEEEVSAYKLAGKIFSDAIRLGLRTIVFTKARKITELIYSFFSRSSGKLTGKVSSYRAGYLPEERREIEKKLFDGELLGVISTSALELGVDIGNLDVCILVGYPGSIINTLQRSGRVGRGRRPSLTILIAQRDALDQFFVKNPENFFQRGVEDIVFDSENPYISKNHILCSAYELPLRHTEIYKYEDVVKDLLNRGRLVSSQDDRLFFPVDKNPHRKVNIRDSGDTYRIIDSKTEKVVATVSGRRVFSECHRGAIYLHKGINYYVKDINLLKREIIVSENFDNFYTVPLISKETEILGIGKELRENNYQLIYGKLRVTEKVIGFERKDIFNQNLLAREELDLPPYTFETEGFVIVIPKIFLSNLSKVGFQTMGSLHAIEHAIIGLMPTIVLCDRQDVGGICYPYHYQLNTAGIFIYDGYDGGIGLSLKAFTNFSKLLSDTLKLVKDCECESGCPSCIHSPKCGSQNHPLDKEGAKLLMSVLLACGSTEIKSPVIKTNESSYPEKDNKSKESALYFDLETKRLADEVGGWQNAHLMGLSLGVVYDEKKGEYEFYEEKDVEKLIERLEKADLVVGFNTEEFDFKVLTPYAGRKLKINSFDILKKIREKTGKRKSLNSLVKINLGDSKSGDGLTAVKWFREGDLEKLKEYCKKDVELLFKLHDFIRKNGYLLIDLNDKVTKLII